MLIMYIQPPVVCDYQTVTLSVELTSWYMNGTNLIKYLEYRGNQSLLTVVFDMEDGLVTDLSYSLVVTAISGAGKYILRTRRFQWALYIMYLQLFIAFLCSLQIQRIISVSDVSYVINSSSRSVRACTCPDHEKLSEMMQFGWLIQNELNATVHLGVSIHWTGTVEWTTGMEYSGMTRT